MKVLLLLIALISIPAHAIKLTVACRASGDEFDLCKIYGEAWAKQTGNEIKMFHGLKTSNDRLNLFQQFLSSRSSEIDVILIDVIWPGILDQYLVDLNSYIPKNEVDVHLKAIIENNTDKDGKLLAMPFFTDTGVLYYRKDLLDKYKHSVPQTWAELKKITLDILEKEKKFNPKLQGFIWQGKAYEGLTCNALEWISSFGGGSIIDNQTGEVTVNNPKAIQALNEVASWIGTISPREVLNLDEDEGRTIFQEGNAIFMRGWPYVWALANNEKSLVKGKIGMTALPMGGSEGKHAGTLGGWNLAISKYSKYPKEAASMLQFMAQKSLQRDRALKYSLNPTIPEIYNDEELLKVAPIYKELGQIFSHTVARPAKVTGKSYSKVSNKIWIAVRQVITREQKAEEALPLLEKELNSIKGSAW